MRVLCSNFSANAMAQAYLLLRHSSFELTKFLLFIILLIDERLVPVCTSVLGVLGVCAKLLLVNKSVLQLNQYFFWCCWPRLTRTCFSIHGATIFKMLQKSFYGCVSPIFQWMVFSNFIRRPPFFFIISLNVFSSFQNTIVNI